jgi:hypothetical protein
VAQFVRTRVRLLCHGRRGSFALLDDVVTLPTVDDRLELG